MNDFPRPTRETALLALELRIKECKSLHDEYLKSFALLGPQAAAEPIMGYGASFDGIEDGALKGVGAHFMWEINEWIPGEEFRIFTDADLKVERVEFWYHHLGPYPKVDLTGEDLATFMLLWDAVLVHWARRDFFIVKPDRAPEEAQGSGRYKVTFTLEAEIELSVDAETEEEAKRKGMDLFWEQCPTDFMERIDDGSNLKVVEYPKENA